MYYYLTVAGGEREHAKSRDFEGEVVLEGEGEREREREGERDCLTRSCV